MPSLMIEQVQYPKDMSGSNTMLPYLYFILLNHYLFVPGKYWTY